MDPLEVLGSKARLAILRELSRDDMYVSELMEAVGMDGKTAKHHLDLLEDAGVVTSYRDGRRRYYRLASRIHLEIRPSPNRRFVAQITEVEGPGK